MSVAARGAPTESYLKTVLARGKTRFQRRNQRIRDVRDRRWNKTTVEIPENFKKTVKVFHSPMVRDLLRRAQAILASALPTPKVIPLDPSKPKSVENASLRAKWLTAAYRRMNRQTNFFPQVTDAFPSDGQAVWKVLLKVDRFDPVREPEEEDEEYNERADKTRKTNWPFIGEHVDTTAYFPLSEDDEGVCEVIEYSNREAYPLLEKYGSKMKKYEKWAGGIGPSLENPEWTSGTNDIPDTVEFVEYWNRDHYAYWIDGELVEVKEHKYKRPPYFSAFFSTTSSKDPEFETEGIADPLLAIQDKVEEMRTMQMNWAYLSAFPVARMKPATDDAIELDPETVDIVWEPGGTMNPVGGNVWEWVPAPNVGGDITALGNYFEEQGDKVSLAPILYGQLQGDISGPAAQSLISLARAVFGPGLTALAEQFDEMADWMQRMIEDVIITPVPVWEEDDGEWLELGPDDIKGYYEVRHSLEPITELERMSKAIWLADAQARGAISMEHYRTEGLGLVDPEAMDRAVKVEKFANSDSYSAMIFSKFMERMNGTPQQPQGPVPPGTPPNMPIGPGGPGIPQVAGVQQGMLPGMAPEAGGQLAMAPGAPQQIGLGGGPGAPVIQ